jgi:hypothetical protein
MINNKMKIKVRVVNNVNEQIVGKANFIHLFFLSVFFSIFRRRNTNPSQSGAETEERTLFSFKLIISLI